MPAMLQRTLSVKNATLQDTLLLRASQVKQELPITGKILPRIRLALEYLQPPEVAHSNAIFEVALTGVGEGSEGHHSRPTPPLLL